MSAATRTPRWADHTKIALVIVAAIVALPFTMVALLAFAHAERR